jgi:hypothetical protein
MNNKEYTIPIPNDLSNYVESLFHEYNAIREVLHYIRSQGNNLLIYEDEYKHDLELKEQELEYAKEIIGKEYNPFPENIGYYYEFKFSDYSIVYREMEED